MPKKLTEEEFIEKAKAVHDDKYDYSKVEYINSWSKVCVICKKHGEFWQTPHSHLSGKGCAKCSNKHNYTTEEFIERAKIIHNNKYDYSKVNYINNRSKICVICKEHGEFYSTPDNHTNNKSGCPICNTSKLELEVLFFF